MNKKSLFIAILIGTILSIPAVLITFSPQGQQRLSGVSVYSDQVGFLKESVNKIVQDEDAGIKYGNLFHNRRVEYAVAFAQGYLTHFSPKWLFLTGDSILRHHAPETGLLYLFELPLILYGLYLLFQDKSRTKWFIVSWILLAPVAAAPTVPVPHAIRSFYLLIGLVLLSGIGFSEMLTRLGKKRYGIFILFLIFISIIFNTIYYFESYYRHLGIEYSRDWQYGYKQAYQETQKLENKYKQIVVSGKLEQPYIFYLFYAKYDPNLYLSKGGSKDIDFNNWSHLKLDKYEFKFLEWDKETDRQGKLYVGRPQDFPSSVNIIKTIKYLNGKPGIVLVEG